MSKNIVSDEILEYLKKCSFIYDNHEKLYKMLGKGVWLYQYDTLTRVTDVRPVFVPQKSIIMFVNDIRFYQSADECSETVIPILTITKGIRVIYSLYYLEI